VWDTLKKIAWSPLYLYAHAGLQQSSRTDKHSTTALTV
jgi:hypothetical protein